ncbi:hypothetical protein ACTA71_011563 [Dictyostelium dimigraforme]
MNKTIIDISDNSLLFFKIWRNCVLKKIILKHLMMFNLFSYPVGYSSNQYNQLINNNEQYLKSLIIIVDKEHLNLEILQFNIPNHIESIILNEKNHTNCDLPNLIAITNSLKKLKLHNSFNQQLISNKNNKIFSNLTTIEFGHYFNQLIDVDILPNSLRILKFGNYYNQPINENVLPKSLEIIVFQFKFNQSLKYLPQSIKEIKISFYSVFKQRINSNELPSSITKLSLPSLYNVNLIDGILPNTLLKLKISSVKTDILEYQYAFKSPIYRHLKLQLYNQNGNLSSNQEISNLLLENSRVIPPSVRKLTIFYNHYLGYGSNFKSLSSLFSSINLNTTTPKFLYYWFYHETSKVLLDKYQCIKSLKVVIIENNFTLDNHSKSSLSHLINLDLRDYKYTTFIKPIKDFKVFTKLKFLKIGNYNSTITLNTLPPSIELLELGNQFKQSIHKKWLPISIKHIIVLNEKTKISINSLPESLESIWISNKHYQLDNFKFLVPLFGKLNIISEHLILNVFNKILKKKYKQDLY